MKYLFTFLEVNSSWEMFGNAVLKNPNTCTEGVKVSLVQCIHLFNSYFFEILLHKCQNESN